MDLTTCTPDALVAGFTAAHGRVRETYGTALLARYDKVIEAIIRDDAARAGVHVGSSAEKAELRDELRLCLFEAAQSYDAERTNGSSGFDHWVRYSIHNRLSLLAGEQHAIEMPESWQRVARIASRVEERLHQQLHRLPTSGELRDGVLAHAVAWAKARIVERDPGLDGAALEQAALDKLRKQGTLGAIERLDEITALRGRMDSLDVEVDVADRSTRGEDAAEAVFALWNETERCIVERRMGLEDGREWTFEEIAAELAMPWPDVRRILGTALAKPRAPHAQFVYLAGVDSQIDDEAALDSAVARLRRRATPVR